MSADPRELLIIYLPKIDATIRHVVAKSNLPDPEDFASHVKLKFVEDDYKILRSFQGFSQFETYISSVIRRLLLDYRNAQVGKWRPSAEAKRLGPLAQDLEIKVQREGKSLEQAAQELRYHYKDVTIEHLKELFDRLPVRERRPVAVDIDNAQHVAIDARFDAETGQLTQRVSQVLNAAVRELTPDDRTLIRWHYGADMQISQISRLMQKNHHSLYRRCRKIAELLRSRLHAAGISASDIEDLAVTRSLQFDWLDEDEVTPSRVSEIH
jgi:RNA polymerase sigma factor (sigma-70 family)